MVVRFIGEERRSAQTDPSIVGMKTNTPRQLMLEWNRMHMYMPCERFELITLVLKGQG